MTEITTRTISDMEAFSAKLVKEIALGSVIFLNGELGSGKTTFVQSFAKALGVKEAVKSPSFIIHNEYSVGNLKIHHLDLYRLGSPHELDELKIKSSLSANTYIFIEWADKFENELMEMFKDVPKYKLDFEVTGENERLIKYSKA